MEDVYRFEIRQWYLEKKKLGILPSNLLIPTIGRLKKECLLQLQHEYLKTDLPAFKSFFEQYNEESINLEKCHYFSPDKFRALVSYLRNDNIKTDIKNIELLAILIDFKPRPYQKFLFELQKQKAGDNPYIFEREHGKELFFKQELNTVSRFALDVLSLTNNNHESKGENVEIIIGGSKLCIEYPSGARIWVDRNEIDLISRLVRI
ncbi:MAG: hypothetical protein BGO31_10835 [Bacteroidetes bacterium 43-16]|uniref:hypothetical protein n=1 Tax=uncultured Dysgonomonas sp. TaxID=206096 RepID=UPI0009267764|nr:hypothetical protein [uncultured Dysgonomonas sp.]OJV50954.1 MAG: hypothetical protein BGO31_10835 [Bacteroidetes bacterium 43-16]